MISDINKDNYFLVFDALAVFLQGIYLSVNQITEINTGFIDFGIDSINLTF
jgi:hypothetical protein